MENYYVERTFSFQVNTFAKSGSVWENIQKCLKEELGEEGADTKLEKSDFTIFENKGVVNVFNAKNQLVAICEGTVINKNIACEGILINEEIGIWDPGGSTFWVGSIIKRDKKPNIIFQQTPIFISHGEQDDVLPVSNFNQSLDTLKNDNYSFVSHLIKEDTHTMSPVTIKLFQDFIKKNI